MGWIILSIVFLGLFVYLLWIPILLFIDTSTNQYFIQVKGLAKANIESDDKELIKIRVRVFFNSFYVYPLRRKKSTDKTKERLPKNKGFSKKKFKTVLRLVKTFKINRFYIDIDTGDCISNAKLYPIFAFLNHYKGGFNINFEGRNKVLLSVKNRPIRIIRSFINI